MNSIDRITASLTKNRSPAIGILGSKELDKQTFAVTASLDRADYTQEEISAKIEEMFDQRLTLAEGTVRVFDTNPLKTMTAVLVANTPSKEYSETAVKGMTLVTANLFMDQNDKTLWKVAGEGPDRRLIQTSTDDLSGLLQARRSRHINLANIQVETVIEAQNGDYALYYNVEAADVSEGYVAIVGNKLGVVDRTSKKFTAVHAEQILAAVPGTELDDHDVFANEPAQIRAGMSSDSGNKYLDYMLKLYKNTPFYDRLTGLVRDRLSKGFEGGFNLLIGQ